MALWFGISILDLDGFDKAPNSQLTNFIVDQQIHGPYVDTDALESAINEKSVEAISEGDAMVAVPLRFELCTDDVPELVN